MATWQAFGGQEVGLAEQTLLDHLLDELRTGEGGSAAITGYEEGNVPFVFAHLFATTGGEALGVVVHWVDGEDHVVPVALVSVDAAA